jgi:glutamate-1-semialdehyde 2,1-aminomutase
MVGHADWAMFCKNGTDATTMALTTARAHTRRKKVVPGQGRLSWRGALVRSPPRRHHRQRPGEPDPLRLQRRGQPGGGCRRGGRRPGLRLRRALQARRLHRPGRAEPRLCAARPRALRRDRGAAGGRRRARRACASPATAPGRGSASSPTSRPGASASPTATACRRCLGSDKARKAAASIYVTGSFWYQAAPMAAALETLGLVRDTDYLERITALGERLADGPFGARGGGRLLAAPDRAGDHAALPVRRGSRPEEGLLLRQRDAGPRRLHPPRGTTCSSARP